MPSSVASEGLCFMIVAFTRYLQLYDCKFWSITVVLISLWKVSSLTIYPEIFTERVFSETVQPKAQIVCAHFLGLQRYFGNQHQIWPLWSYKSRDTAVPTGLHVHPAKTQVSLWLESSHSVVGQVSKASTGGQLDTQANLSLRWAHMQSCRKYCAPVHMV